MSDLREQLTDTTGSPPSQSDISRKMNLPIDIEKGGKSVLIEDREQNPTAYVMLIFYMFCMSTIGYNLLYIQPIAQSIKKGFDVDDSKLSLLVSIGSISSSIAFLPLTYILAMKGVKLSISVGLGLLVTGTLVELIFLETFDMVYVGHFITHFGIPIFNIGNAKFCSIWFTPKVRPLAITLNSMTSTLGIMISFIIPSIFVDSDLSLDPKTIRSQVRNFHIFLLCAFGSLFLVCIFFFKEAPAKYTTYYEEERRIRKNLKFFTQFGELLTDPTYVSFTLVLGVGIGLIIINQLLVVQMMTPFDFTQTQSQIAGALIVLSGLISSIVYSKWFIHYPHQLKKLRNLYLLIILAYTLYAYLPTRGSLPLLYLGCIIFGGVGMIQVAIGVESLVKYIIITGPQRLVVGSSLVQVTLSAINGILSYSFKGFLNEGTRAGIFKINVCILIIFLVIFLLSTFLEYSFTSRVNEILNATAPKLLPQSKDRPTVDPIRDKLMRSLA